VKKKKMNTKNKIVAILMAGIVAMAVGVPMAMGVTPSTSADVTDAPASYAATAVTATEPDPVAETEGSVDLTLVVTDNNGDDTIPDGAWTAVCAAVWATPVSLTADGASGTDVTRTCTGTGVIPANQDAGIYTVSFQLDGVEKDTADFAVGEVLSISATTMTFTAALPGASPVSSHNVNNTGNVVIKFVSPTGIVTGAMSGSGTAEGETIPDSATTTSWTYSNTIGVNANADVPFTLAIPTALKVGPYAGTTALTPTKVT
jgi:hypothetical protein